MFKVLTISRNERVAHVRDGELVRVYGPGEHWVWTLFGVHEWIRIDVTGPVLPIARGDPLPEKLEGARVITVEPWERAVLRAEGLVRQVLGPGRYRIWDVDAPEILRYDLRDPPEPLPNEDRLVPNLGAWTEHAASEATALVLSRDGAPVGVLLEGRYRLWADGPWAVRPVSRALRSLDVAAQDLVTADQVPVRVKPAVAMRVVDPLVWVREIDADAQAYGAVQLALREGVAARTLEQLVAERDALSSELLDRARALLPAVGLALERVYVKDVILPGEIRDLINRVTLARKEAEALAIKRREEVATTRQLANTAKLLEQNPVLLRLKELEALGDLVARVDKLVVVGGPAELARPLLLREIE